jgi:hypothetical protein
MGIGVVSHRFCCVCGTEHHGPASCPGELRATGAEKPGWRINVETPFGHEDIGVLLAPSHDQWRARIVTYPSALWTAPGGRGTLKFVAETREQAEAQAVEFVRRHIQAKLRRGPRRPGALSNRPITAVIPRKLRCLPVRFGIDRAIARGVTVNLSVDGMFVGVAKPEDGGRSLLLHLDVDGHTIPMRGLVMWIRRRAEAQRPPGMGIRLSDPPPLYQSFVAALP